MTVTETRVAREHGSANRPTFFAEDVGMEMMKCGPIRKRSPNIQEKPLAEPKPEPVEKEKVEEIDGCHGTEKDKPTKTNLFHNTGEYARNESSLPNFRCRRQKHSAMARIVRATGIPDEAQNDIHANSPCEHRPSGNEPIDDGAGLVPKAEHIKGNVLRPIGSHDRDKDRAEHGTYDVIASAVLFLFRHLSFLRQ